MYNYEKQTLFWLGKRLNPDADLDGCGQLIDEEWASLLVLVSAQGVSGLIVEPINNDILAAGKDGTATDDLPVQLYELYAMMLSQEKAYSEQLETASKLAGALKNKGVEMKVLKGIAFSTYYDDPSMRECGDCDCYLTKIGQEPSLCGSSAFETGNETCAEIGGTAEYGTYKHSHLYLDGLMIENHHYLTEFNNTRRGIFIEKKLEKLIESTPGTPIGDTGLVCPSGHFNALFLIVHALQNFMSGGISLRILFDWASLLKCEQGCLDWDAIYLDMEECGVKKFADIMTAMCVRYLGLSVNPSVARDLESVDPILVEEIILDTMRSTTHLVPGETLAQKARRILKRFARMWRYRRLATENYLTMIWNSFAFSSYLDRKIEL